MPVVIAGTHFAQNLEIRLHPGQPSSGRLTQVKFDNCFKVPVINAGTHFAQTLDNRLTQVKSGAGSREGGPELRAELSEDIIGDGQTLNLFCF